jgi:hypothetical protein
MRKIVAEQERGHAVAIELSIGETQLEEDLGLGPEPDRVAPPGPEQRPHRERVSRKEQACPVEPSEREIAGHVVERLDASTLDHLREQCRRVGADRAGGFERSTINPDGIDPCVGNADPIVTLDDRMPLGPADECAEHGIGPTHDHRSASVRRHPIRRVTEPICNRVRRVDETEDPTHPVTGGYSGASANRPRSAISATNLVASEIA